MTYRTYDHRIKRMISKSGDPNLFPQLEIPKTTALNWIINPLPEVVTLPELNTESDQLVNEIQILKQKLEVSEAKHQVSWSTFRLFGLQVQYKRIGSDSKKRKLVEEVDKASKVLTLKVCLELIGLSSARYHAWIRSLKNCNIASPCPRVAVNKLTSYELSKIKEYLSSNLFSHFSITALSIYAKRQGEVFASPSTWVKICNQLKLRNGRRRLYPTRPKLGIRADAPGKIWQLDLSIIRLKDSRRVYIQSVVDNFSRFVVATKVTLSYCGIQTNTLLESALENSKSLGVDCKPKLISDKGSENINSDVQSIIDLFSEHVVAQIDIDFSNSMVESFFRRLKNGYLYYQSLDSIELADKHVSFFVQQHNEVIPLAVLNGATPLECYLRTWNDDNNKKLTQGQKTALKNRISSNKEIRCELCID